MKILTIYEYFLILSLIATLIGFAVISKKLEGGRPKGDPYEYSLYKRYIITGKTK